MSIDSDVTMIEFMNGLSIVRKVLYTLTAPPYENDYVVLTLTNHLIKQLAELETECNDEVTNKLSRL